MDPVESAAIELGKESPFYTYVFMYLERVATSRVRTLKLRVSDQGRFQLFYNPELLENKPKELVKALLLHELLHIINGHVLIKPENKRDRIIWDLAMDAAVNQHIPGLYAFSVPLDVLIAEGCGTDNERLFVAPPDFMPNRTAEEYHRWILEEFHKSKKIDLEIIEEMRENVDSHEDFGTLPISQEMVEDLLKQVVSEAVSKSRDRVPPAIKEVVDVVISRPRVHWKTALRRFVGSAILGERYRTPMRPNRRYSDQPGWRREYLAKIAIILDTSGSIIEDEINAFLSEIDGLTRLLDTQLWMIQVDEAVRSVTRYSKGQWKDFQILGRGGTDLQPAVDYAQKELRVEGLVIFTDGYVDLPLVKRRVLFVLSRTFSKEFAEEARQVYGTGSVVTLT
ncbi:MAG: hypothetical protein PWP37_427 [Thermotogota bacterium]|nr:hypothetical protein [Thermotogota bacterium]MDK2864235.1 hypothetical protein [Thermotogota bacterium]